MNKKSGTSKAAATKLVKSIRRKTRQTYSAEEKIRIVLAGLRGEESISALCRPAALQSKRSFDDRGEGISEGLHSSWSKEFLEAGKRRLSGDTAGQVRGRSESDLGDRFPNDWSPEVKDLRSEAMALKECVADLTLENRLLKKKA